MSDQPSPNLHSDGSPQAISPSSTSSNKRKRTSVGSQPANNAKKDTKSTATKRACNECRQQKLRCDVELDPYKICSRCERLHLDCRITANFHRIDKRNRNAEMERELSELRARLAEKSSNDHGADYDGRPTKIPSVATLLAKQGNKISALHQGVADSLIDLHHSSDGNNKNNQRRLGSTVLASEQINDLFKQYFAYYHPFLPLLDPEKSPDYYFELSDLLFWTIIAVSSRRYADDPTLLTGLATSLTYLVWDTVAAVPQNYHVVKALCLLCTWPLPTKSSTTDPTFMLSGLMMQIAMQTGLHRPSSTRDFSKTRMEWREEDITDRLKTWATCNIVSQNVSTGYGMPPNSHYDYALIHEDLPNDIHWRLRIERFANQVSTYLYQRSRDPAGITKEDDRRSWVSVMANTYRDLEREVTKRNSAVEKLYLQAAWLHCTLSAFFDSPTNPEYIQSLLKVYVATRDFLDTVLEMCIGPSATNQSTDSNNDARTSSTSSNTQLPSIPPPAQPRSLKFAGFYIMQMILAAGFTLMKLLNSFFATHIDIAASRRLFNQTVRVVRASSINNNDLPGRLAEVLAQLWRSSGAGMRISNDEENYQTDSSLQLKIRCRMSMSLVYDSVWRWRETFQQHPGEGAHLDLSHPTRTDGTPAPADSSVSSTSGSNSLKYTSTQNANTVGNTLDPALGDDATGTSNSNSTIQPLLGPSGPNQGMYDGFVDPSYEVFDPITWMLDGGGLDLAYTGMPLDTTNVNETGGHGIGPNYYG